jgi:hypothetical protein
MREARAQSPLPAAPAGISGQFNLLFGGMIRWKSQNSLPLDANRNSRSQKLRRHDFTRLFGFRDRVSDRDLFRFHVAGDRARWFRDDRSSITFEIRVSTSDRPGGHGSRAAQTPNSQMGVDLGALSDIIPPTKPMISGVGEAKG